MQLIPRTPRPLVRSTAKQIAVLDHKTSLGAWPALTIVAIN
jgi:hypothetical protein